MLAEITGGQYFKKSELAIAVAKALRNYNRHLDVGMALDAIAELDYWLQTESGRIINRCRWIYKTFKDWWRDWLPVWTEYKVRQVLETLRELGIFKFEQHRLYEKHFDRSSWWSLDYERLKSFAGLDHVEAIACSHVEAIAVHTHTDTTINFNKSDLPPNPQGGEVAVELGKSQEEEEEEEEAVLVQPACCQSQPEIISDGQDLKSGKDSALENLPRNKNYRRKDKEVLAIGDANQIEEFQQQLYSWYVEVGIDARWIDFRIKQACDRVKAGEFCLEWQEFKQGLPLGISEKEEWEYKRGIPYPLFVEYLMRETKNEKISTVEAISAVGRSLSNKAIAGAQWAAYKRFVEFSKEESDRLRAQGVEGDTMPCALKPLAQTSVEDTAIALQAISSPATAVIEGFAEVEEASPTVRARRYGLMMTGALVSKSVEAINELLKNNPDSRKEIFEELLSLSDRPQAQTWASDNLANWNLKVVDGRVAECFK